MTAGLGAAIAAGQGVASASPGEGPDSGATSSAGQKRSANDTDTTASKSESTDSNEAASRGKTEAAEKDSHSTTTEDRKDELSEADDDEPSGDQDRYSQLQERVEAGQANLADPHLDEAQGIPTPVTDTPPVVIENFGGDFTNAEVADGDEGPVNPMPVPVESLGLAVRDQQHRRELKSVAEISATSQQTPQTTELALDTTSESALASLAIPGASPATAAAVNPPNWFATALNNAWVFARNITNAVVETTRRVIDGVVRVTVAVIDGVAQFLFGEYDSIPVQTPTDTRGHWERLRTVTGGFLNDGFHIDKVRSAYDGVERLTVYIGGTNAFSPVNQPLIQNSIGWSGQPQWWQVDAIERAVGANRSMEILVIGFSQGGMDAQNLMAHSEELDLNVAMVLTFGSPVVQDPPVDPYDWIFHIQAYKDPVPDWGQPGKRELGRVVGTVFETDTKPSNKFWADWNGFGEVHMDPATYREAAEKFDDWLSDSNMDYWEGQYIRSY